jgi:predicted CoA-substrate-specific enzyme activase
MACREEVFVGIDIGSVSAKTVLVNQRKEILEEHYQRTLGQPLRTAHGILSSLFSRISPSQIKSLSFTGTAGKIVAQILRLPFENEIIAQSKAIELLHPHVKTVIEMGGEDSKLIFLDGDHSLKKIRIVDFAMNSICAAGTGSFLDQQAHRLGLSIEEFGQLALKSKNPPRIAGRCSVFAKTDMIHLQQSATPDYDIVCGLCYAVGRNFKSTIGKGKSFRKPIAFQGGVAANAGMRRAFTEILGLEEGELLVPRFFASMGAIGAVLLALEKPPTRDFCLPSLEPLEDYSNTPRMDGKKMEPLVLSHEGSLSPKVFFSLKKEEKIPAYLGVDVGSISTNVVVIDREKRMLAKRYLMTAGRPIEAIKQGLKEVGEEVGSLVEILGVGTTGSGRYLTGDFIGADIVKNEITAQATAALHIDPRVDTIFEIGGQDSKYISLRDGAIVDFEMNKVCAAGTGSFLEEQAEKLGISIKEEFGNLALSALNPVPLGERCTVFMGSDLVHYQQKGASKENLVAGLSYSIVLNYLNKVVGDRRVGENIFFQGGTAWNAGVVAAFEEVLKKSITVPDNHEVTGALGAAIIALENSDGKGSRFKGFDLSKRDYELGSFECSGCPNLCKINRLMVKGEEPLFYGGRCERYEVKHKHGAKETIPDLFQERHELLNRLPLAGPKRDDAPLIGIPRALFFYELLPFFHTFLTNLGFKVVFSEVTHKGIIHQGVESVVAETCFPIKVAHGHIHDLLKKNVESIFLPSIITMEKFHPEVKESCICPYIQSLPYVIQSSIDFPSQVRLMRPVLHFGEGGKRVTDELIAWGKEVGRTSREVKEAVNSAFEAQDAFAQAVRRRGEENLSEWRGRAPLLVIVSRPYNGCDPGLNLNIHQKLRDLGVLPIPLDFLPLEDKHNLGQWKGMYWGYGQKILATAEFLRENTDLHAIYLTNFGCGPDSFITHFFRQHLKGIPFLTIEIDEHSADVGVLTRVEAFLDSLKNLHKGGVSLPPRKHLRCNLLDGRCVYLPNMSDHAYALSASFEACGVTSQVLPESDEETLKWGRAYTSGRECFPCILTTGDMIKMTRQPDFQPEKAAFFMPSGKGPCRFGQYYHFHRLVLDDLGYPEVSIFAPIQDENFYDQLGEVGKRFTRLAWQGVIAIDLLEKKVRSIRPYEKVKGEADEVYQHYLQQVLQAIKRGEDLQGILIKCKRDFDSIGRDRSQRKPVVGVVGEIYIRSNRFANDNLVRGIEELGGEVWLPPVSEWTLYTNFTAKRRSFEEKNLRNLIKNCLMDRMEKGYAHRMEKLFNTRELSVKEILDKASPYLHLSFEGEAILSIGKAVDFVQKGASGIINAMPFTCMPGTVVNSLLKRCREDLSAVPVLTIAYDGQKQSNIHTRLEAFLYQVRQYAEVNWK